MPELAPVTRFVRKQAMVSAVINTVLSAAIFMLLVGLPTGRLTFGAPDYLAFDFLPQCGMVGLMSALVAPFIARKELAALTGTALYVPSRIIARAAVLALLSLAVGAGAALLLSASPLESIASWQALAFKALFGGALGAFVTVLALRPMTNLSGKST